MIYDAFISYNSRNLNEVRTIVEYLRNMHFRVYFDDTDLHAGRVIEYELQNAIGASDTILIIIGESGIGPWQKEEYLGAHWEAVKRSDKILLPVVLPGANLEHDSVPMFLRNRAAVKFEHNVEEPENLQKLVRGLLRDCIDPQCGSFEKPVTTHEYDQLLKSTIKAYDVIAEKFYERWCNNLPIETLELLGKHAPKGACILDAGCGPGHHSKYLASKGFNVTGIDLSKAALNIAKSSCNEAKFIEDDMRETRFPRNSYDGLWACASCVHTPDAFLDRQLREFVRIVKPGGIIGLTMAVERLPAVELDGRFFEGYQDQLHIMKHLELAKILPLETSTNITSKMTDDVKRVTKWFTIIGKIPEKSSVAFTQ